MLAGTSAAHSRSYHQHRFVLMHAAQAIVSVVHGLTSMSVKQLKAVSHLLAPQHVEAIKLAARLPHKNQGRKRQENLVAKLLRTEMNEAGMKKLMEAVEVSLVRPAGLHACRSIALRFHLIF